MRVDVMNFNNWNIFKVTKTTLSDNSIKVHKYTMSNDSEVAMPS